MELKDFLQIFRVERNLFIKAVLFFLLGAWVWQISQPVSYQATLLINIGRTGVSETTDYTYDSFYRLQADERFADTVVRWLGTPRVVEDIYREAHIDTAERAAFRAGRVSSQVIIVKYDGGYRKTLEQLSTALVTVLNRYTNTLNTEGQEKSWFVVLGSEPVLEDARVNLRTALLIGLALGLFVGFWAVLFRHYFLRKH
jgi:uncharacterized protein involved in exopolysaccharide biosynthesis